MTAASEPVVKPLAVRVNDLPKLLGVSRATCWRLLARGAFETVKLGKCRVVMLDSVERFLDAERARQQAGR
jgi:predicted DNA-binding transcriptional regulator AlpA